jgi:hypothetical protein
VFYEGVGTKYLGRIEGGVCDRDALFQSWDACQKECREQEYSMITSIERGDETPVAGPHLCALLLPPRAPLDAVTIGLALPL